MENLIGTTVKGYELTELIGEGGFGMVYRAYQESVNREVALKVVLPEHANHPEFIRRFETEAQLVARLEHMHIVPLYDFWRDPDGAYLVMRYVRGGNLRNVLDDGAIDLERIGIILDQLASALAFVHRNQIVHRDIKPSNILFDEDGNVYLVDFGLAKLVEERVDISQADKTITGSPDYIAPEQVRGEQVSPQTDIYSLGIVIYEMLTGVHPFADVTPIVRISKHLIEPLPLIEGLPTDLAQGINEVIQKATSKEPSARFEDVHALASNYREAAGLGPVRVVERGIVILTRREGDVLEGIVEGRSNQEIARSMELEQVTVQWHKQQLYRKIGARSRAEVVMQANKLDLIVEAEDKLVVHAPDILYPMELVNPYKGLQPFQLADEGDFFGREALVSKILDRMSDEKDEANRFLAIIGPSGSGKSSLVKAGVIPALARGECQGSEDWYVIDMTPGAHPLDELDVSLVGIASRHIEDLRAQLGRDVRGLVNAAGMILPDDDSEILLVIDQFEELYVLVEDEAQRNHFLDLLCHAVTDPQSRVRVLITMRADFYDRPLQHPEFGKLIQSRMETVLPMNVDELERAITSPAARVGVTFEEGLPASIISDMHAQPGALPLLQYALTELFEARTDHTLTSEGYQSIGGAVGALAKKADTVYLALEAGGKEAVRHMLTRLVAIGEGAEESRRRVPRPELLAIAERAEVMEEVIDTFANYRLLSLDYDPTTRIPTVELAHEALLREWGRLRNWVDEARDDIRMQRRLAVAAGEWREAGKDESFHLRGTRLDQFANWAELTQLPITPDEREYLEASLASREERRAIEAERKAREAALELRSRRFLRALVGVLAVASVIAIGLAAFALNQRGDALDSAARAERSAATATVAQGQALFEAATAVAAEDEAQRQQSIAEREARAALEAYSLSLAANAQEALNDIDTATALVLALAANNIDQPPARSQKILMEAAYAPGARKQYIVAEVFEGVTGSIVSVDIHSDGLTMLLGFEDGTVILWDIQSGEEIHRFVGHTARVNDVAYSPNGLFALSASEDTLVMYWDIATGKEIHRLVGHSGYVMAVDFSPDGRTAITGGFTGDFIANPGELILWDLGTGQEISRFDGHHNGVTDVEFTPEGSVALAISGWLTFEGADILYELFFWDLETGEAIRRIETFDHDHTRLVISPNGTTLTSSANSNLYLWDLQTGEKIHAFEGNSSWTSVLEVSDDGRSI
jgi:DNA-binding CsgD family transcriptional regulator/energy-coupling factor transporter ATP-binding protein EcfA2